MEDRHKVEIDAMLRVFARATTLGATRYKQSSLISGMIN